MHHNLIYTHIMHITPEIKKLEIYLIIRLYGNELTSDTILVTFSLETEITLIH
jgi:hypothetical protein